MWQPSGELAIGEALLPSDDTIAGAGSEEVVVCDNIVLR
jgi:hypothetical protein